MFVLGFDFGIVDKKGNGREEMSLPQPDWNDTLSCRPKTKVWVGFKRREGVQL